MPLTSIQGRRSEAITYGGLQASGMPREFTTLRGMDVPANFSNIFRIGFLGNCYWSETVARPDGQGYDILFIELGGSDWAPRPTDVVDGEVVCNPLTYKGPLAALQPNWKDVPVCVEEFPGGGLKKWSRIHRYSPRAAGGAAGMEGLVL